VKNRCKNGNSISGYSSPKYIIFQPQTRDSTFKRPVLSNVETFILENDFHENSDHVHHSHLIENPLHVHASNENVSKSSL
jgi:hypothetical protein